MFTQTHVLISTAIFARKDTPWLTAAAVLGALLPDTDVWAMFLVEKSRGLSGCEIFHFRYWEAPWTTLQIILNAIPAYLALVVLSAAMMRLGPMRLRPAAAILGAASASALLHVSIDFALHHDDARAQWMPFSDWVFRSPISYWDPQHHGDIVMPLETLLGLSLIALIGRRARSRPVWALLLALSLGYAAAPAAALVSERDHPRGPGSCDTAPERWSYSPPAGQSADRPVTL